jgi:hypothetical protein
MFNSGFRGSYLISGLIGLIFIALGGVPLLKLKYATMLPLIFSPTATKVSLLIGGVLLLYYGFRIKNPFTGMIKGASILTGLLLAIIGAIPLLVELGWFNKSLPFIATLNIPIGVLQGLLIFFGLYLLYDAFILSKQFF